MRRARSAIGAAAGLLVLAGGLAIIDERVRFSLMHLADGNGPGGELAQAKASVQDTIVMVLDAIRDQSIEHAPLTVFVLGAIVLVLFMTRT